MPWRCFSSVCLFALAITFALPASAQMSLSPFAGQLLLRINPSNPEPNSHVSVTLSSLAFDLSEADIAWYVNEKRIAEDQGLTEVDVVVGAPGSITHVAAYVTENGTSIGSADVYLNPAEVDILWESDSFTPPLYKGKKLASPGSSIRAEAHALLRDAKGNEVESKNIVYTWRRNNALVESVSGRGKFTAIFPAPLLFDTDMISVEAVSIDSTSRAENSTRIPSVDPFVILYQDHPLFGIQFNAGHGRSATLPDVEATFAAIPYFAPDISAATDEALIYEWRVNGASVPADPAAPDRLTVNAANSSGLASIELSVSHLTDIFMSAKGRWDILLNAGLGGTGSDPFAPETSL